MRQLFAIGTFVLIPITVAIAQQASPLKIVVLEGEGAVNIIQQKTAVRPLIEVRARDNLPVAGASVTFSIGGGGQGAAFAGGAQTLTVTTNAAGQAAASSFSAVSSGAVQIQVQAVYQGQIATAAISQTNFATAAAAAQAGAGAGGGGGAGTAGGAAGGGGGGISGTTIGIIGGAVAGGAVAATQVVNQDEGEDDPNAFDGYSGSFSGTLLVNSRFVPTVGPVTNCTLTWALAGTLRIELKQNGTGSANLQGTQNEVSISGNCIPSTPGPLNLNREDTPVTGGPSAIVFSVSRPGGATVYNYRFSGSLSGNNITGTLTIEITPPPGGNNPTFTGSVSMPVTLTGPRP